VPGEKSVLAKRRKKKVRGSLNCIEAFKIVLNTGQRKDHRDEQVLGGGANRVALSFKFFKIGGKKWECVQRTKSSRRVTSQEKEVSGENSVRCSSVSS